MPIFRCYVRFREGKVETIADLAAMWLSLRSHQTWTPNHWAPRWKHTKGKHFIGGFKLEKRYLSMCIYIYSICISCALGTIMHYIDILFAYMIFSYVTNGFIYVLQLEPWSGLLHHPTAVVGIVGTQRTSIFCASCVKIPLRYQPGRAQRSAAEGPREDSSPPSHR